MLTMTYAELERLVDDAKDDVDAAHDAANALNVDYWGAPDDDRYVFTDIDDYIESALDACHPDIPESMNVVGVSRVEIAAYELDAERLASEVYECLDEEYNASDELSEPPHAVLEAARAFLVVVKSHYVPWNCEQVVRVMLNTADVRRKLDEFWPEEFPA